MMDRRSFLLKNVPAAAFRTNPDWAKIRDESIRRGGEIVRNITNLILAPTSFSMIR